MTLLEFIKSTSAKDTQMGDLARDILRDKEFPAERTEEGMVSYLNFKTRHSPVLKRLLSAFEKKRHVELDISDAAGNNTVLRSETWKFLKKNFPVDRIIAVGEPGLIYRVYAIDSKRKEGLRFDLNSNRDLNDIQIISVSRIPNGNLTKELSVAETIEALKSSAYGALYKANESTIKELISFLEFNELLS